MKTPPSAQELAQRDEAARRALRAIEPQTTLECSAFLSPDAQFRPRRLVRTLSPAERKQRVSLIIPTRDRVELLQRCVDSLRQFTHWPGLEIIVVDNDSAEPATHRYLRSLAQQGVHVLPHAGAFNFAAMNNEAVGAARGDIIGLINNDIEALHEGWLDEIVGQLLRPGIGVVGAKLLWPNGMVQHGGVVLGMGNGASHFGNRLADGDWGDHGRNQLLQQVSAVTAACLFLRRADWLAVGGMDALAFPVNFNDVDLCLKMRARGRAVVWTPHARLLHAESASRGKDEAPQLRARLMREIDNFRTRWGANLLRDPAYHPSLNLDPHSHPFGGLAIPPRDRAARTGTLHE
jgi:GT2 family glycosyltransferase